MGGDLANYTESIYTGTFGRIVRAITPPFLTANGVKSSHRVLAVAELTLDQKKEDVISLYGVEVKVAEGSHVPTSCNVLHRLSTGGKVTAMETSCLGNDKAMILSGNSLGDVLLSRVGCAISSDHLSNPQLMVEMLEDESLSSDNNFACHQSIVSDISINRDNQQVVSVGKDGSISLLDLRYMINNTYKSAQVTTCFTAVKWDSAMSFVTAGSQGGLNLWDVRQKGSKAALHSPKEFGGSGIPCHGKGIIPYITCLDVHTSRQNYCVTGSTQGIALWDLRFSIAPSYFETSSEDVTEVLFDPMLSNVLVPHPPVLYSTNMGTLASLTFKDIGINRTPASKDTAANNCLSTQIDTSESKCIQSFTVDPLHNSDIYSLSDSECLLYSHRSDISGSI